MSQQKNIKLSIRKIEYWNIINEEWYYSTKLNKGHKMEIVHEPCYKELGSPTIERNNPHNVYRFSNTKDKCPHCETMIPGYVKTIAMMEWI